MHHLARRLLLGRSEGHPLAVVRQVERDENKRDLALAQVLRHTGIRAGELTALRLGDVTLGERKGQLVVRSGKGSKYRVVPLNADARQALKAYLTVRLKSESAPCFSAGAQSTFEN